MYSPQSRGSSVPALSSSSRINLDPYLPADFEAKAGSNAYLDEEDFVRARILFKRTYAQVLENHLKRKVEKLQRDQTQEVVKQLEAALKPAELPPPLQPIPFIEQQAPAELPTLDVSALSAALAQLHQVANS